MKSMANLTSSPKLFFAKLLFLVVAVALVVSLTVAQAQAKTSTVTSSYRIDLNLLMFVACANNGAGEYVSITGPLNVVFVTTLNNQGGFETKYELQFKGISATGQTTGSLYRAVEASTGTFTGKVNSTYNLTSGFKMTRPLGDSFLVRENVHVTINAKGGATVSVDNFTVTCKRPSYPG